jgi:hypothetical protein
MSFKFNPFTNTLDLVTTKFTELSDTPQTMGTAYQLLQVDSSGNTLEFINDPQNINSLTFNTTPTINDHVEGRLHWNEDDGTIEIDLPGGNVKLQSGFEILIKAKNVSGAQVQNGQAVYVSGASGVNPEVTYANASNENAKHTLAVATEDVDDNGFGYFTTFGLVRDIDTSFGNAGDSVYLNNVDGGLTTSRLRHPNYEIEIGHIIRSHATEGILLVNIVANQWLKICQTRRDPTGFDRSLTDYLGDISFNNGTRTFTIAPKATIDYFSYWFDGVEVRKSSGENIVIDDTDGLFFIYYENGSLVQTQTPWTFGSDAIFVAVVYWDSTNSRGVLFDERHGNSMSWPVHEYLHNTVGAAYRSGFSPSLTVDGNGSLDAHCEMQSVSSGIFYDEDIKHENDQQTTYEIWYKIGASGSWQWDTASASLVKMATTYPYYNEFTGGSWQLTEIGNNRFMLMHIFAANKVGTSDKIILVMGENSYLSASAAREAASTELLNITTSNLPTPEFVEIASVIIQVAGSYANQYNARVISTDLGEEFIDFRQNEKIGIGATVSSHENLTDLQGGAVGEHYHLTEAKYLDVVNGVLNDSDGSAQVAGGLIATDATDGFLYIPTTNGTPTGTPTTKSGYVPVVYDTSLSRLYVYTSGQWKTTTTL